MAKTIGKWLDDLGLQQYVESFQENDVDHEVLESLNDADLRELGVSLGHRKKLLKAIEQLNQQHTESGTTGSMSSTVPPAVAERRQLTVMFIDLVGSTALSEQYDPEDLSTVLREYQHCCQCVVTSFNGYIARYSGDGILVYFGYPQAYENDVERALLTALKVNENVGLLEPLPGVRIESRIGIATGLVVVGETIGRDASKEQVVVGETPNLAARLQGLASPGSVVASGLTFKLARQAFEFENLGEHRLKGLQQAEQAWRVLNARQHDYLRDENTEQTLVGREDELNLLKTRWSTAASGEGQAVVLEGEAGIGKSMLADALRNIVSGEQSRIVTYQCSQLHSNTALYPAISQLESQLISTRGMLQESKLKQLLTIFGGTDSNTGHLTELLADLMSIDLEADSRVLSVTPARQKQLTFELLINDIITSAEKQPLCIFFEDVHWADASTLKFVDLLLRQLISKRILLIITHRTDFDNPLSVHTRITRLTLTRLAREYGIAIIAKLCGDKPLPEELLDQLLYKADGNPLYLEELTKNVLESDSLKMQGHRYVVSELTSRISVPSSLNDSLMARLDKLPSARRIAQTAAVIGRDFEFNVLSAIAGCDTDILKQLLVQLEDAGIIIGTGYEGYTNYSFKHALVQDAAYDSILNSTRRSLHAELARFYVSASEDRFIANEIIAEHLHRAGDAVQAMRYRLQAGQRAIEIYAHTEAITQLQRCLRDTEQAIETDAILANKTASVAHGLLGDLAGYQGDLLSANEQYEMATSRTTDLRIHNWIKRKQHHHHTTQSSGGKISYYVHGEGDLTLLMMNPIAYGLNVFQPLLDNLCQDFKVVTMDCRGTGLSDPLVRPYGIDDHMQDVAAVISSLGEPVTGIGISRGSNVLMRLAVMYPQMLDRLITVGCPVKMPEDLGVKSFDEEYMSQRIRAYKCEDIKALVELQYDFVYTEPGTDEVRKLAEEHALKLPKDTILSFYDPDPVSIVEHLAALEVETLVMHGVEDKLIPLSSAEFLAEQLPNAMLYKFDNQGHLPMWTATSEFCYQIRLFTQVIKKTAVYDGSDEVRVGLPI